MPEMSYKWEPAPHTADLAIAIESSNQEGLFRAAFDGLLGLLEIPQQSQPGDEIIMHHLNQKFRSVEEGLVDFLNECIYLMDGEDLVPFKIESLEFHPDHLAAVFSCREVKEDERPRIAHIKAATYSDLAIEFAEGTYKTRIIFDT